MKTSSYDASNLPRAIVSFFSHLATDSQAVARCFTEDAVVLDEGREHYGSAAIAAWNADVIAKYACTTEPVSSQTIGAQTTVTANVSGNFLGSPIRLRFRFTVAGDLIIRLEISP
ncbi:nuclear transport factor 2 family protein [Burkholderia multivorans]|uniref:nuclear transport factor 2 family protein n=1 Tax=Burkholderia multivorans TaxID=87883 RepID=UPI001C22A8B7|nr:nuclear transport factor 2 family protein [Burkholderia multivorans]MBU9628397.1 nuclear transport factor 2 family protein [Burkholderia multivorans]